MQIIISFQLPCTCNAQHLQHSATHDKIKSSFNDIRTVGDFASALTDQRGVVITRPVEEQPASMQQTEEILPCT